MRAMVLAQLGELRSALAPRAGLAAAARPYARADANQALADQRAGRFDGALVREMR